MKRFCVLVMIVLSFVGATWAQSVAATSPCLIVKHKGTLGRRLMFTALIGLPIAPGAKFDYVDSRNFAPKMAYKGKELEALQARGVRIIVLETKYAPSDLESARKSCSEVPK